jgi:hypothetical protein
MFSLLIDLTAPRRPWGRALHRARATWMMWATLDPLTQEHEAERFGRGIALAVVLSCGVWAMIWLVWGLA